MPTPLFYVFAIIAVIGGIALVSFRNPVASALSMAVCFGGLAAVFISLNAFFVAVIQILVYAGAIMVLFMFIIMLLDLPTEEKRVPRVMPLVGGLLLVAVFAIQLAAVLSDTPNQQKPELATKAAAASYREAGANKVAEYLQRGRLPDVHLIGYELFTHRNKELQIVGTLLLVATVGAVTLSIRKRAKS